MHVLHCNTHSSTHAPGPASLEGRYLAVIQIPYGASPARRAPCCCCCCCCSSSATLTNPTKWSHLPTLPPPQAGKLEKWVKSEEPPADNSGPVRTLTAKTFDEEVFKSGRDTFIKFYAPWW